MSGCSRHKLTHDDCAACLEWLRRLAAARGFSDNVSPNYSLPRRAPTAYQYPPLPRRVYVAAVVRELWWLGVAVSAAGAAVALVAWGGAW